VEKMNMRWWGRQRQKVYDWRTEAEKEGEVQRGLKREERNEEDEGANGVGEERRGERERRREREPSSR